jgi:hypothetical protein
MSHGWVRRIELDNNDNLSLLFAVSSTYVNTPIEITGTATQANGAVATFYDVQVPTGTGQEVNLTVGPVPTVGKFVSSDPITVVARAAYVWITSLQAGGSSPASIEDGWAPPTDATDGSFKAQWTWTSEGVALCPSVHPSSSVPVSSSAPSPQPVQLCQGGSGIRRTTRNERTARQRLLTVRSICDVLTAWCSSAQACVGVG